MKLFFIVLITYCVHSLQAQSFSNLGCVYFTQIGSYAFDGVLSPTDCSSKCTAQDPAYKYFILYQYNGATCECFFRIMPNSVAAITNFCDFKCDKNCVTNCAYCGSSDGNYANKYAIGSNSPTTTTTITTTEAKQLESKNYSPLGCVYFTQIGSYAFDGVLSPVDCSSKCAAQDPAYKVFILYQYDGATCECFLRFKPNSVVASSSLCDFKCDKNCLTNCAYCGSSDGNYANKFAIL